MCVSNELTARGQGQQERRGPCSCRTELTSISSSEGHQPGHEFVPSAQIKTLDWWPLVMGGYPVHWRILGGVPALTHQMPAVSPRFLQGVGMQLH